MTVRRAVCLPVLAVVAALALTGCAAATADQTVATPTPATVQAHVGDISISGGYVPAPASPDVVAAYLTISNAGNTDDAVTAATSDAGGTTTLHRTDGGEMVPLDELDVPAHGLAFFRSGAAHLMIENPTRAISQGGTVTVTLTFEHAGNITVKLPVTSYSTGGSMPSMPSMSPMPGMS